MLIAGLVLSVLAFLTAVVLTPHPHYASAPLLPGRALGESILQTHFNGTWAGSLGWNATNGVATAKFYHNMSAGSMGLRLNIQEERYVDCLNLQIYILLPRFNGSRVLVELPQKIKASAYETEWGHVLSVKECELTMQLGLSEQRSELSGRLKASDCKLDLQFTLGKRQSLPKHKLMNFYLYVLVMILVTTHSSKETIKYFGDNYLECDRVSVTLLLLVVYLQVWLSLTLIYISINILADSVAGFLAILSGMAWFTLGVGMNMRLLALVWRDRIGQAPDEVLRHELMKFYLKFYLGGTLYFLFMYRYSTDSRLLLLHSLTLLPQILRNVARGNACGWYPHLMLGLVAANHMLPLYVRGCPDNILVMRPQAWYCITSTLLVVLTSLVSYLQSVRGPRFFIPRCLIPNYYEYAVRLDQDSDLALEQVCGICMLPLAEQAPEAVVWRTPCLHSFHPRCIKGWIDIKLECPYCRALLPVPN